MLNSLNEPTRCRNHSRATKIGALTWKRKALCSNGVPCRSRSRKRTRPRSASSISSLRRAKLTRAALTTERSLAIASSRRTKPWSSTSMVRFSGTTCSARLTQPSVSTSQAGTRVGNEMQPTGSAVRALALAACAAGAALLLPGALQAQTPERPLLSLAGAPDDALSRRLADGRLTEAQYALERARSVFQLRRVRHAYGDVARPGRRDATLILRDLAARKRELSGPERELAEALLARPDDGDVPVGNGWTVAEAAGSPVCSALPGTGLCVHWVASSSDAPSPTDSSPANGVPDWIDLTLATWETVWTQEIGAIGYREPLPDGTLGDDNRLDVYVDDLGSDGVFGYCTSDDPNVDVPGVFAVWAYCVVDDDYAPGQYGSVHTPQEFLGVTSAHEFNHASQFAYDWLEDVWLLEGTATNIEETVYPNVNDNVSFLRRLSPLSAPGSPLDRG